MAVLAVRDDRQGAFVPDLLAHFFAVVGLVGGDASGDRGVFSISSTTWLSWTCPPVTVKLSGRPLLSTIAWIFVVRPPRLTPIA